jgi:hypothetical protein
MAQFILNVAPDSPENARAYFSAICDTLAALCCMFENVESELTISACSARGIALVLQSVHQELVELTLANRLTVIVPEEER